LPLVDESKEGADRTVPHLLTSYHGTTIDREDDLPAGEAYDPTARVILREGAAI